MAKKAKKPAPKRLKQPPLPETETIGDRVLDEIGEELAEVEETRMAATKIETDCRQRARSRMERAIATATKQGTDCPYTKGRDGSYIYKRGALTLTLEPGEPKLKVRFIKQDITPQEIPRPVAPAPVEEPASPEADF